MGGISSRRHDLQAVELFTLAITCYQRSGRLCGHHRDQRADPKVKFTVEVARSQWTAQRLPDEVNLALESPSTWGRRAGLTFKARQRQASNASGQLYCEVRSRDVAAELPGGNDFSLFTDLNLGRCDRGDVHRLATATTVPPQQIHLGTVRLRNGVRHERLRLLNGLHLYRWLRSLFALLQGIVEGTDAVALLLGRRDTRVVATNVDVSKCASVTVHE